YTPRDIAAMCEAHHTTPRIHVSAVERIAEATEGYAPGNVPMTGTVVVTDDAGADVVPASEALRGALRGQSSMLKQVRPWVRFRTDAHYLFLLFSVLCIAGAGAIVGPAGVLDELGSWSGRMKLIWALL